MPSFNDEIIAEFRTTKGHVGRGFGSSLVLIHTVGRSSGKRRVNPAMSLHDGDDWLVVGSAAGAQSDPAWVKNLRAHPRTTIEVPRRRSAGGTSSTSRSPPKNSKEPNVTRHSPASRRNQIRSASIKHERAECSRSSDCVDHPLDELLRRAEQQT
ncbi:nitroreductase/quinone reductase family protein [Kribbella sp. ALI-6-A]|uniref:nitroreductase/quinone reductase family protein n=1 Tax=Kribbella sp. ALI-6-A TaxID=1933817 RepID=UPI00192CEB45|nr:nitroreductase/quinone reductase family protein [Kribbella sp. ALI-6-A]